MRKTTRSAGDHQTGRPAARSGLQVRIDANHCRTLTLAAHERELATVMPQVLARLAQVASTGSCSESIHIARKGVSVTDKQGILMTMRGKLDALGFTVIPSMREIERVGYVQTEPVLEVRWL